MSNRVIVLDKENAVLVMTRDEVAIISELLDYVPDEKILYLKGVERDSYHSFNKKLDDIYKQWDNM